MLSSPSHAVVGTRDLEQMTDLLGRFGFTERQEGRLEAAAARTLYGLDEAVQERTLAPPGAAVGHLVLVETPHAARQHGAYDHRPVAIDFYTRDIEQSVTLAREAGCHLGPVVDYAVGPLELREFEAQHDGLTLVFIEIDTRRPSLLDNAPERLHSELHSIVFAVPSAEEALKLWRDAAGLEVLVDAPIRGPVISELMELPRPNVPVRFVLLCDGEQAPARFELLEFFDDPGKPVVDRPLTAGLDAAVFRVEDLAVDHLLPGCTLGPVVDLAGSARPASHGRTATAPGGLRFELWEDGSGPTS